MFRRVNIKTILILFFALLAVFVVVELVDSSKGERSFPDKLVQADADNVTQIRIFPRVLRGQAVDLVKEGDVWKVESNGKSYNADQSIPGSMISELNKAKPISLAGRNKEQWKAFEVTDSLGTRVQLFEGGDVVADVVIGKFNYQAQKMTSYIRLTDEKDIYGVDGFLSMMFNREIKGFRDPIILKSNKKDWAKLTFTYAGGDSFELTKTDGKWMVGSTPADSAAVESYLSGITNLRNSNFVDTSAPQVPTQSVQIEGNNMMAPIHIDGFFQDEKNFLLQSNQNEGTLFNSPDIAKKLFVTKESLINP